MPNHRIFHQTFTCSTLQTEPQTFKFNRVFKTFPNSNIEIKVLSSVSKNECSIVMRNHPMVSDVVRFTEDGKRRDSELILHTFQENPIAYDAMRLYPLSNDISLNPFTLQSVDTFTFEPIENQYSITFEIRVSDE